MKTITDKIERFNSQVTWCPYWHYMCKRSWRQSTSPWRNSPEQAETFTQEIGGLLNRV